MKIENGMAPRLNEDIEKLSNDILKVIESSEESTFDFSTNTKDVSVDVDDGCILLRISDKN